MSSSKCLRSSIAYKNFKKACPRCIRIMKKAVKSGQRPKLINNYKGICKNSKCFTHRVKCLARNKKKETRTKIPTNIDDFEGEMSSSSSLSLTTFIKIESSIEDLDAVSESFFKNLVGYREIKEIIDRTIIWPLKNPGVFKGLRTAPRGILFFGPPGTGKSALGKYIAFNTNSTFFNISASTLSSKWMGETEKLLQTLFLVAKARQPSVIFFNEIDSILSDRIGDDCGSVKRLKNEFLFRMGAIDANKECRVVVVGATSRPQDLDETVRPKFLKRIYVPLPYENDRKEILTKLLECERHSLEEIHINDIVNKTEGYSVLDLKNLSQEAAMISIKSLPRSAFNNLNLVKIRPIFVEDFYCALKFIKPTVSEDQVKSCESWDVLYGYGGEGKKKDHERFFSE